MELSFVLLVKTQIQSTQITVSIETVLLVSYMLCMNIAQYSFN